MEYNPKPFDTSAISLDKELLELMEGVAQNIHENWAAGRIKDGWVYGEKRDDEKKTHPCLVPYEELTEVEKDYDRITSMETLKSIKLMGFDIVKR